MKQPIFNKACAAAAIFALVAPTCGLAQEADRRTIQNEPENITVAPKSSDIVARHMVSVEAAPNLSREQKIELLRKKIKYVFVLFQENRSFDFYFGTYPGARGLFSQPANQTAGFIQPYVKTNGQPSLISPFLIPQSIVNNQGKTVMLYPEDTDSVNHSHAGIDTKLDYFRNNVPYNDRYAYVEQGLAGTLSSDGHFYKGPNPTEQQVQKAELVMGHVDCDTAPFLWNYADRFVLFDNFFDTVIGPSTPNAIAMIAGQSGETQWVKHPELGANNTTTGAQLPVTADPQPFWGSALDIFTPPDQKQPVDNPGGVSANPSSNLTFAALPLSFMGDQIKATTQQDLNPAFDLLDVRQDINKIAGDGNKPVNWGWFQEGYDHEPTDPAKTATNSDYIAHHNAPQYFGYIANNPTETKQHLKGLGDFYSTIKAGNLPADGGVFYVRGGYGNIDGLVPRSPSPVVKANFQGNDDHPAYSDAQISEALLADSVNAIASSKYWPESAIIITYDETDGLYDHAVPKLRSFDSLKLALDQGPRIPTIVISPYSKTHVIDHEATEHGSIIKFIDELFKLTPLADLPDELNARAKGVDEFHQAYLGPSDDLTPGVGDMLSAFDNKRLTGKAPVVEAEYAMIPDAQVKSLPHAGGQGCRVLQITPTDVVNGKVIDPAPADFNPRPSTNPGVPATTVGWPLN